MFLYFLPAKSLGDIFAGQNVKPGVLATAGLNVLADCRTKAELNCWELTREGPGGSSGLILSAAGRVPKRCGFFPTFQIWKHVAQHGYWIGYDKEQLPGPETLARARQRPGYSILLGDGNQWSVPIARSVSGETSLPSDFDFDDAGQVRSTIKAEFLPLWEAAGEAWDVFVERVDTAAISLTRGVEIALLALAVNYRLGPAEQNVLHLLDSDNCRGVLGALVDLPLAIEYFAAQKKTQSPSADAGTSASPGSADTTPATDPAAAS